MRPIHKTVQDRSEPDPPWLLPWMYSYDLGQIFIVERKRAGKVVKIDTWKLVQRDHEIRRWELVQS